MKTLYPDQLHDKRAIYHEFNNGHLRVIYGAGTGSGKTVVATDIINDAISKGLTPMFVVNQIQLVKQAAEHMIHEGINVSIVQGDNTSEHHNQHAIVASIQSIATRRIPDCDFIVIDEIHIFYGMHEVLLNTYNNVKVLALSATPMRKGLGKYFTSLVRSKTMQQLIDDGRLTPFRYFGAASPDLSQVKMVADDYNQKDLSKAMNKPMLNGDIVENWIKHGEGSKTICFPVDIAHSKAIVQAFCSADIRFEHVDAYTNDEERARIFHDFNHGDLTGLSSVGVLTTGFDAPIARCMINASPTKSLMKFIQKSGRIARKYKGKEYSIFIDHTGDIEERHGFPHDFEIPDLSNDDIERTEAQKPLEKLPKPCPKCNYLMMPNMFVCENCGYEREKVRIIETTNEDLQELGAKEGFTKTYKASFARQLLGYSRDRGWKDGWAYHAFKEKFKAEPEQKIYRMKTEEPTIEVLNYIKYLNIKRAKQRAT